ncbi:SdrD B-like domain protein [uncultured archaeon]|nr:SdrD B-like domain protein [uncultured archaeon]
MRSSRPKKAQEFEILSVPTPAGSSISGFKIKDLNKNGEWDAGEVGLPDWEIELRGIGVETRHIKMVTFTDATGAYRFDDLPAGKYLIKENLKKGFIPTSKPVIIIKLVKGEDSGNNNFTNRPIPSLIK